jgi:hypothetical protein
MVFGDFVVEIYEEYLIWITQTSLDFIKKKSDIIFLN